MRKRRLTYANVMATTAVVIALSGGAYVAWAVEKNSIESQHIVDGEVKTRDLANGATIDNARKIRGNIVRTVSYKAPANDPELWRRLFKMNGLTVWARCLDVADDRVVLRAVTNTDNSIIGIGAVHGKTYGETGNQAVMFPGVDNDFDSGMAQASFPELDDTTTTMSYGRGPNSNQVVTATFLANQWQGGTGECKVVGTVIGG